MNEVRAFIKPHMLSRVILALHEIEGLTGLTVSEVQGFGRGRARGVRNRIVEDQVEYVPHVRIEAFCRAELVEAVVTAIQQNAHTGLKGDGKIYVLPVAEAVRISTGERGAEAV